MFDKYNSIFYGFFEISDGFFEKIEICMVIDRTEIRKEIDDVVE